MSISQFFLLYIKIGLHRLQIQIMALNCDFSVNQNVNHDLIFRLLGLQCHFRHGLQVYAFQALGLHVGLHL